MSGSTRIHVDSIEKAAEQIFEGMGKATDELKDIVDEFVKVLRKDYGLKPEDIKITEIQIED